jgi:hypothetical protein
MARGDISIYRAGGMLFTAEASVASGTVSSIKAGEPTTPAGATGSVSGVVALSADASPTTVGTATNVHFSGLAKSDSAETAAAAGPVTIWAPMPGILYAAKAKSAAAVDTAAEIVALLNKRVILDLTTTVWTVDTGATDAITNGVIIYGGDPAANLVYFGIAQNVTVFSTGAGT